MNDRPSLAETILTVATRAPAADGVLSSRCAARTATHSPPGRRAPTSTYSWTETTARAAP